MLTTKSLLREIRQVKLRINRIEEQKQAIKASYLLSEGLLDILIDVILGPFIHADALELRKSKEYKDAMKQIKELEAAKKKLDVKADKLQKIFDDRIAKETAAKAKKLTKRY